MKIEIPNTDNPFKYDSQSELAMAWELGWYKRNEDIFSHIAEVSRWGVDFRRRIREAVFPFYPNNPCSTDDELIEAIKQLVEKNSKKK